MSEPDSVLAIAFLRISLKSIIEPKTVQCLISLLLWSLLLFLLQVLKPNTCLAFLDLLALLRTHCPLYITDLFSYIPHCCSPHSTISCYHLCFLQNGCSPVPSGNACACLYIIIILISFQFVLWSSLYSCIVGGIAVLTIYMHACYILWRTCTMARRKKRELYS